MPWHPCHWRPNAATVLLCMQALERPVVTVQAIADLMDISTEGVRKALRPVLAAGWLMFSGRPIRIVPTPACPLMPRLPDRLKTLVLHQRHPRLDLQPNQLCLLVLLMEQEVASGLTGILTSLQLADDLGITREMVQRLLRDLKQRQLVEAHRMPGPDAGTRYSFEGLDLSLRRLSEEADNPHVSQPGPDAPGPLTDNDEIRWCRRQACLGHASAQHNLGQRYLAASENDNHRIEACAWWMIAADNGYWLARQSLARLLLQLSLAQRQLARQRADHYLANLVADPAESDGLDWAPHD
jgi:DNA-binding IscR family transcriptional regulator